MPRLAALVYHEEGIIGFFRGLWIPLMTISFVRTFIALPVHSTIIADLSMTGAASFTIYSNTKDYCGEHNILSRDTMLDVALIGALGGSLAGGMITFGSVREFASYFSYRH